MFVDSWIGHPKVFAQPSIYGNVGDPLHPDFTRLSSAVAPEHAAIIWQSRAAAARNHCAYPIWIGKRGGNSQRSAETQPDKCRPGDAHVIPKGDQSGDHIVEVAIFRWRRTFTMPPRIK